MKFWYRAEVEIIANRHALTPDLVQAVCLVESSGLTTAYRPEPAFWERYLKGKPEWDGANPARVSASYGLMQVMFPVAVEHGMARTEPPEYLFVPLIGLDYGCRVLAKRIEWARGDVRAALASYNGGQVGNAPGGPLRNAAYA
ncbi:MAG TPA: transglycosylase SLT domain-containing protein, partial [Dokdonella sp.]